MWCYSTDGHFHGQVIGKEHWQSWRRMTRPLSQKVSRDLARCDGLQHHVSSFRRFSMCLRPPLAARTSAKLFARWAQMGEPEHLR